MKNLLVLCVVAVALGVGECKGTYRSFGACTPGQCFVKDGLMCKCSPEGSEENAACIANPPLMIFWNTIVRFMEASCTCTPGEIFQPNGYTCTCPESGELTPENCVPRSRRRSQGLVQHSFRRARAGCEEGHCVVDFQSICRCSSDGVPEKGVCITAPPREVFSSPCIPDGTPLCDCNPGEIFLTNRLTCLCPKSGKLIPAKDCICDA